MGREKERETVMHVREICLALLKFSLSIIATIGMLLQVVLHHLCSQEARELPEKLCRGISCWLCSLLWISCLCHGRETTCE